jgi:hypothetical protein
MYKLGWFHSIVNVLSRLSNFIATARVQIKLQMSFYSSCSLFGYKIFKITSLPSAFTIKGTNTSVACNENYTTITLKNHQ